MKIVLSKEGCWVHSEYRDEPGVLHIEDLGFIADDDLFDLSEIINVSFFNPLLDIEENTRRFIEELDVQILAMCFDRIVRADVF